METLCVTADKSGDLTIYGALVELVDTRDFNEIGNVTKFIVSI